jgi:hypothetical protein
LSTIDHFRRAAGYVDRIRMSQRFAAMDESLWTRRIIRSARSQRERFRRESDISFG